jgi:hypothetical protein
VQAIGMIKNAGFIVMFTGFMLVGLGMTYNAVRDGDRGFILWCSVGLCIISLLPLGFIVCQIARGGD